MGMSLVRLHAAFEFDTPAQLLRFLRCAHDNSFDEMAEITGVPKSTLESWIGERVDPKAERLFQAIRAMGYSIVLEPDDEEQEPLRLDFAELAKVLLDYQYVLQTGIITGAPERESEVASILQRLHLHQQIFKEGDESSS